MFILWRRLGEHDRRSAWWLYGWFSALIFCGSCVGVATWATWMQAYAYFYIGEDLSSIPSSNSSSIEPNSSALALSRALSRVWFAWFYIAYAVDFFLLSTAKLMVLDRMIEFSKKWASDTTKRRFELGERVLMALVVSGNAVGLAANIAAAVQRGASSESYAMKRFHHCLFVTI